MIRSCRWLTQASVSKPSVLSSVQTCQSYLNYCKNNQVDVESTTFKGTLYELFAMQFLQEKLKCHRMVRVGGAFDEGVDIVGRWNLKYFWDHSAKQPPRRYTSTRVQDTIVQPLVKRSVELQQAMNKGESGAVGTSKKSGISLGHDIRILVQCKNHGLKIQSKTVRELAGAYYHHTKSRKEMMHTFMFLVSPHPLTTQALALIDSLTVPIIHCKLTFAKHFSGDFYSISSWEGGNLDAVFMNAMSRALVKGLPVELVLKEIKNK